jgi:hypothetical protein
MRAEETHTSSIASLCSWSGMPPNSPATLRSPHAKTSVKAKVCREAKSVILGRLNDMLGIPTDDRAASSQERQTGKADTQILRANLYREIHKATGAHRPKLEQSVEEYCTEQRFDLTTRKGRKKYRVILQSVITSLKNSANHILGGGYDRTKKRKQQMFDRLREPSFPSLAAATELLTLASPNTKLESLTLEVLQNVFTM